MLPVGLQALKQHSCVLILRVKTPERYPLATSLLL